MKLVTALDREHSAAEAAPAASGPAASVPAASSPASSSPASEWIDVCALADLEVERGRAALIGQTQLALFLLHDSQGSRVHAVSNRDPYSGAHVISRGIVGTREGIPTVASPMYKQVFDLRTGACLDTQGKEAQTLQVWPAAVDAAGRVQVRYRATPEAGTPDTQAEEEAKK